MRKLWAGVLFVSLMLLTGCDDSSSADSQATDAPRPSWLTLTQGTKTILIGAAYEDPSMFTVVQTCENSYSEYGCKMRRVGQIVTVKSYSVETEKAAVHGDDWSAEVDATDLAPIIPAGAQFDCDDVGLYTAPDHDASANGLQGTATLREIHTRKASELWGVYVRVVNGWGKGKVGWLKEDDLVKCFLPGHVQISLLE
jgi:hypothetical protein